MERADPMSRARAGDGDAFRELTELYRRELQADLGPGFIELGGQLFAVGDLFVAVLGQLGEHRRLGTVTRGASISSHRGMMGRKEQS